MPWRIIAGPECLHARGLHPSPLYGQGMGSRLAMDVIARHGNSSRRACADQALRRPAS